MAKSSTAPASALPPIRSLADIEALERTPLEQQNAVWTVYELVARGAALDPDKAAFQYLEHGSIEDTPQPISFRQVMDRVHRAANLFHSLGVGPRDPVAILLPIVPQNYYALLGGITAGIAFPINWMLAPEQIAELLAAARAKVVVALGPTPGFEIWQKVEALRAHLPTRPHVVQVKGPEGTSDPAADFDALCAQQPGSHLVSGRLIDPRDAALYVHTGGTTGLPKIAPLIHRAICYKAWAYRILLAQEAQHVNLAAHPLFHIGGIVHHTMSSLARGQTGIILGPMGFRAPNVIRDYWKIVERYGVTDLGGVPTTLGALANVPPAGANISSLRPYTMTGSAGLPIQVSRYFEKEIGVRILSNYGMTENTATIALPPRDGDPKFGSAGLRLPFTRIRTVVIDDSGEIVRDCAPDEIGEIIISGPGVIRGYLNESLNGNLFVMEKNEGANKGAAPPSIPPSSEVELGTKEHGEAAQNKWLRTGDLGRLDADGYIWVTGRAKDLIIRSGHNIDPLVIEQALMTHPAVALAAAVGKPDAYAGELPVAFVQLKPGAQASAQELHEHARARVPERAAAPAEVFILDALPLTAVGKIFKPDLRERAALRVFEEIVHAVAGERSAPVLRLEADPLRGKTISVSLRRSEDARDREIERSLQAALGRFTFPFAIAWRTTTEASETP